MINSQGKRKSTFIASETILAGSYFDFWAGSVNYRITAANFMSELGVTGTMAQAGAVGNIPVLNVSGTINQIRGLELASTSGLYAEVSAENGITLRLDAQSTGDGVAVLNTSNKVRRIKAGDSISISLDGEDIVITSTPGASGVSQETGITAYAGGGQANATELTKKFNFITVVGGPNDSVKLPAAVAGLDVYVINDGSFTVDIFPGSGGDINGVGVDTAQTITSGARAHFYCYDSTNWTMLYDA